MWTGTACVGYSSGDGDGTSDQQRSSSSTVDGHTRQTAPRCQSTTTTKSYGCVARHLAVTDDDLHAAQARLDAAETYVHLSNVWTFAEFETKTKTSGFGRHGLGFTSAIWDRRPLCVYCCYGTSFWLQPARYCQCHLRQGGTYTVSNQCNLSVILSARRIAAKVVSGQPLSLKVNVGPTSRQHRLTDGDPEPDTDSRSLFNFPHHCGKQIDLRRFTGVSHTVTSRFSRHSAKWLTPTR